MNEAADVLWCRRPRLFWLKNLPILKGSHATLLQEQQVGATGASLPVLKL